MMTKFTDTSAFIKNQDRSLILLYFTALFCSYGLIIVFHTLTDFFPKTIYVFILLSVFLSLILPLMTSDFARSIILLFRCYLVIVQYYGIEEYYIWELIWGISLLIETCVMLTSPLNSVFSLLFISGIIISRYFCFLYDGSRPVPANLFTHSGEALSTFFILGLSAACLILIKRKHSFMQDLSKNLQVQKDCLQAMAEINSNLQNYAQHIDFESSEKERNRISREIHDISGYIFTNVIALINAAISTAPEKTDTLSELLVTAQTQAREGLKETRRALRETRANSIPEEEGLKAIHKIITIYQKVTGVQVVVNWGNAPHSFSRDINFALYRTIQEALTNGIRHGLATEITIHLTIMDKTLIMTVTDNGRGADKIVKGIGITGMEERINALGGTVSAQNAPVKGFELVVRVPL